jgi:hypothetical protein
MKLGDIIDFIFAIFEEKLYYFKKRPNEIKRGM